ncbi:MAG: ATP-binding cassette domain-containing protein [Sphingobacteriales bacterium]|nr:MAG: ATP-binding cassette domain-containing protein [Sphingobacteriales bacterium]
MIQFKNLVKRFGDRTVLKGLSLDVKKGEILFILGTSGTGKSVLLKNIVGLLRPDDGQIWIDGQEVSKLTEEERNIVGIEQGSIRLSIGLEHIDDILADIEQALS